MTKKTIIIALAIAVLLIIVCLSRADAAALSNWNLYQAAAAVHHQTCDGISLTRYATRCRNTEGSLARLARIAHRNPWGAPSWYTRWQARRIYNNICGVPTNQTPPCRRLKDLI